MKRHIATLMIAAGMAGAFAAPAAADRQIHTFQLEDIRLPLVPTANPRGDREFGGNGPRITVDVRLVRIWDGKAIQAIVRMRAVETGGDRSTTIGQWRPIVWRQTKKLPYRVIRFRESSRARIVYTSIPGDDPGRPQPGGLPRGVVGKEDGGYIARVRPRNRRSFLQYMDILGDTTGDDISTDRNPRGDTSIRFVKLGAIKADAYFGN